MSKGPYMKVEEILHKDEKIDWTIIIVVIVLFCLLLIFLRFYTIDFDKDKFFELDKNNLEFITNVGIAVASSMIAALLFSRLYSAKEHRKLKYLRNIARDDFLTNILNDVQRYDCKYREEERISATLTKHSENENFYYVELEYHYKTIIKQAWIEMAFFRLDDTDTMSKYTGSSSDLLHYEFYWASDESDFEEKEMITKDDYQAMKLLVITEGGPEEIEMNRSENDNGMTITYRGTLPKHIDKSRPIEINAN